MAVVGMTACVNDLNTEPIDKNSTTSFNQDAVFSKCYATLALRDKRVLMVTVISTTQMRVPLLSIV